jgi:hypothetical protein
MRFRELLRLLFIVLAVYPSLAFAQHFEIFQRVCFPGIDVPPDFQKPFRVPVGCEIIDCCPGCPGAGLIDWRVQVEAQVLEGVELRFEGISARELQRVKASGNGRLEGDRFILRRGVSTLAGLPAATASRVWVASLAPRFDRGAPAKLASARTALRTGRGDLDADGIRDNVVIEQMLGAFVVNTFRWRPYWYDCSYRPPALKDKLKVDHIASADNTVVMMDARTAAGAAGCTDDQVLRSTGSNTFANLLAAAGCNSEIAVFATDNAMRFDTPVNTWTNAVGDLHTMPLQPVLSMPVSVWVANGGAVAQAVNDIANANLLYRQNKIGVQFAATQNNVSGNAAAVATIGAASCGAVGAIRASAWYTANALNIYYVNGGFTGENCARTIPVGDGNISYLGTIANLASLAHEIGHAFGLRPAGSGGHTNTVAGFGNNNIMWGGGPPGRDHFSLGQAFRMNTHTDAWGGTMLINDGLVPGPGRACPPLTTTTTCPALVLDWVRP